MSDLDGFYQDHYERFIGTGILGVVSKLMHQSLELDPKRLNGEFRILEVGAGSGQHIAFCRENYSQYVMTDLRPNHLPKSNRKHISIPDIISADSLPFPADSFDLVIATCLLAHMENPEKALSEWIRVTKPTGRVKILLPCEPSILLRLLQLMVTIPKKKRMGITNPRLLHYRDHKQTYLRLKAEVQNVSSKTRITRWPFPFLSWDFNLWAVAKIDL